MKNIPFFTTEYGVAGLILESIPYRQEAFIHIHSTEQPEQLLAECKSFCIACGAERIYAAGHEYLEQYPFYMSVLEMQTYRHAIDETEASLFPVQLETSEKWRQIYNDRMASVPKAAWLTEFGMQRLLQENHAYFIHQKGELLGIGVAGGNRIDAIATTVRGAGATVIQALCHALSDDMVTVEVASTNERAIALYQRLGFVPIKEQNRWYQYF